MRLNIFRNHNIDAQVGYLIDAYQDALRSQTKGYWTEKIIIEISEMIIKRIQDLQACGDEKCDNMAEGIKIILDDIRYRYEA
jgi:hypothetical protein